MGIRVKLLASLAERFDLRETQIEAAAPLTVTEVWDRATRGAPMPPNTLAAVNMEYCAREAKVKEGDEVAFFPPVTGG